MMNQDLKMTDKVIVQDGENPSTQQPRTSNMTIIETNKMIDSRLVTSQLSDSQQSAEI